MTKYTKQELLQKVKARIARSELKYVDYEHIVASSNKIYDNSGDLVMKIKFDNVSKQKYVDIRFNDIILILNRSDALELFYDTKTQILSKHNDCLYSKLDEILDLL